MRYKLVSLGMVLLIGTPVFTQEMSPIIIKTGQPTPSVVRSGELFKVVYRAEFYDEVLIIQEQMQPENIVAEPFEAVKLEVLSLPDHGDSSKGIIHIREFIYTFRIIKPEKGDKKIPPFNFIWVEKKAGTTEANAKEEHELKEIPTEEVGVRYAYSPVKPPPLNIRDEMNFPFFKWSGETLRWYGYATIMASSSLSLVIMLTWVYFGKTKDGKVSEKNSGEIVAGIAAEVIPDVLPKKARKKFLLELNKLLRNKDIDNPSLELEKKVYAFLSELVLAELSGAPIKASTSDTPGELHGRLTSVGTRHEQMMGPKYRVFSHLTGKMKDYYEDIESGQLTNFSEPRSEVQTLVNIVRGQTFMERFRKTLVDSLRVPHA